MLRCLINAFSIKIFLLWKLLWRLDWLYNRHGIRLANGGDLSWIPGTTYDTMSFARSDPWVQRWEQPLNTIEYSTKTQKEEEKDKGGEEGREKERTDPFHLIANGPTICFSNSDWIPYPDNKVVKRNIGPSYNPNAPTLPLAPYARCWTCRAIDIWRVSEHLKHLPLDPLADYQQVISATQCPEGPGLRD